MSKIARLPMVVSLLALAACGSGGGTRSPQPPFVENPPPDPVITYTPFAQLTGDQAFDTACATLFSGFEAQLSYGFGSYPDVPSSINIDYDASADSWMVEGFAGIEYDYVFGPADLDPSSSPTSTLYRQTQPDAFVTRFGIGARSLNGLSPEYVRTARLFARPDGTLIDTACVFGVPTSLEDELPTSVLNYTRFSVAGNMLVRSGSGTVQYELSESTATLTANPDTGEIDTTIELIGRQFTPTGLSETRTPLGSYSGEAEVDGSIASFTGSIFADDRAIGASNFSGWFFGPQGRGAGYAYSITAYGAGGETLTGVGTVTARR